LPSLEKTQEQNNETEAGILANIQTAFDKATSDDGADIILDNMFIIGDFYNLETLLREVNLVVPKKQEKLDETEFHIIAWKENLKKEKASLEGKSIFEYKIAAINVKKQEATITKEEEAELVKTQAELKKFAPATAKVQNIEETIKNLELTANSSKESVDKEVKKIRQLLVSDLKLSLPDNKATNDTILNYVHFLNKELKLTGGFSYAKDPLRITGSGDFSVNKNAEDVQINADIKINKGKYRFTAKGMKYVEDKEHINLLNGNAVIPRLEGDASPNREDKREYFFDEIGLKLNEAVRGQLKLQQNKLTGGDIPKKQ
jgi:hypothetical protein